MRARDRWSPSCPSRMRGPAPGWARLRPQGKGGVEVMFATRTRQIAVLMFLLVVSIGGSSRAFADEHLRGVITGRGDDGSILVRTDDATNMVVTMSEATKVRQTSG